MKKLPAIAPRRAQHGVILFVALIVLVAMSLAGIALMRSVDTNVMVAGNLAFRQGATLAGDNGIENARAWILDPTNSSNLLIDSPAGGAFYRASMISVPPFDILLPATWPAPRVLPADSAGNTVSFVVHRMCDTIGALEAVNCVKATSTTGTTGEVASTKGAVGYGALALQGGRATYYRVSVRIQGPRNTVSYVQAMLN